MKIQKGKSFNIYVSSKVNDEVLNFLNNQKNLSESIISIIEEHLMRTNCDDYYSLSKRVSLLEKQVFGNLNSKPSEIVTNFLNETTDKKASTMQGSLKPSNQYYEHDDEILEEESDMELLFKQLND